MSGINFVLDTNVLLSNPKALYEFGAGNTVVLPIYVLEELDKFKKEMNELGANARAVTRALESVIDFLRTEQAPDGAPLDGGGRLRVAFLTYPVLPPSMGDPSLMDNLILLVAQQEHAADNERTFFITQDMNLRIRAEALGVRTRPYEGKSHVDVQTLRTGVITLEATKEQVDALHKGAVKPTLEGLGPNEFVLLRDCLNPSHTALGRYDVRKEALVPVRTQEAWGIKPKSMEQVLLLDLLLNPEVQLITIVGKAGTGKTLLSLAAGLEQVTESARYDKVVVAKSMAAMGEQEIGFLPGTAEEKVAPHMRNIFDNLEFLLGEGKEKKDGVQHLLEMKIVEVEILAYIRGRSLPRQFMIIDEAQNLSRHEIKTIITRAGAGTKIILTGDPAQIDNPKLDSSNNGLVYVAERFRCSPLAGHITLFKGERSPLAEEATNLL